MTAGRRRDLPGPRALTSAATAIVLLLGVAAGLGHAAESTNVIFWAGPTMGSTYSVKLSHARLGDAELTRVKTEVQRCLDEVNRQMSHYQADSELSRFNRLRSTAPFPVSPGFATVARYALELNRQSDGLFEPTLGPLINLWGFGQAGAIIQPPSHDHITATLKTVGCRHLTVTAQGALRKAIPDLQLNLSAVAAGFAADEVGRLLAARGLTNHFVNITGEIVTSGMNPEGQKWRVGIQSPDPDSLEGEEFEAVVSISNLALATSGNYRKFFKDAQGRVYSHILNPKTGRPVEHNLASVTVVATNGLTADGLSTALFVLGAGEGLRWIEKCPDTAALFIVRQADGTFTNLPSARFRALTGYSIPLER